MKNIKVLLVSVAMLLVSTQCHAAGVCSWNERTPKFRMAIRGGIRRGSVIEVTSHPDKHHRFKTGRTIRCVVNDSGPYFVQKTGKYRGMKRVGDLSTGAYIALFGDLSSGWGWCSMKVISYGHGAKTGKWVKGRK